MQLELTLDYEEQRLPDGRILLTPGRLKPRPAEEWKKMAEVMDRMPYRDRQDNVALIAAGELRGRRFSERGHWWIEMNSVKDFLKRKET